MEEAEFRQKIIQLLENINTKLAEIERSQGKPPEPPQKTPQKTKLPLDVDVLLSLPDHLRKTAVALSEKTSATADEIAGETGRTRAAESDYLNQLVKMGYVSKKRKGRTVYFQV
jgi:hypothetical protein